MLELLVLVTGTGLVVASRKRMGFGNPFQIYFFIWFVDFLAYFLARDLFVRVDPYLFFVLLVVESFPLLLLIAVHLRKPVNIQVPKTCIDLPVARLLGLRVVLAVVIIALPFVYWRARSMAGGASVFSSVGYIQIRSALTGETGGGYGALAYVFDLAFVGSSIAVMAYRRRDVSLGFLIASLAVSVAYAFLSTGRTFFLLLFCLVFMPLVMTGAVKKKGVLMAGAALAGIFFFVALITAKGASVGDSFTDNIVSFGQSLIGYTIAPLVAFSKVVAAHPSPEGGVRTFRFFIALGYKLGLTNTPPIELIQQFTATPFTTNVYTVYADYFRDFSYVGMFIPPAFLALHQWLYRHARSTGGRWVFLYAASVYPLIMQFFQDQYFSLFSQWIQIVFWYWLLVRPRAFVRVRRVEVTRA